nr:uncharacterized protein LOC129427915 [Misgurnus anguillicaudatus]
MYRDTVQLECSNSENQKMDACYFIIDGRESKPSRSCQLSLTGSDIIIWSGGQRSSVNITCYYSVNTSQGLMPSPRSDPVTVTVQNTEMWQIWWSAVACSVIVLAGLICLCTFAYKKRSKRKRTAGETRASGPANIYSLITSVPDTSKPTAKHHESEPETYSLITLTSQPSDVLVNTQHKKGHTEDDEIVYHVYCTIPDKPVRAVAKDQIYSLAT